MPLLEFLSDSQSGLSKPTIRLDQIALPLVGVVESIFGLSRCGCCSRSSGSSAGRCLRVHRRLRGVLLLPAPAEKPIAFKRGQSWNKNANQSKKWNVALSHRQAHKK